MRAFNAAICRTAKSVHVLAGLLLIAAALLKAYHAARGPSALPGTGWVVGWRLLDLAQVEFELIVGGMLALRIWPAGAWGLGLLAYTVFAGVSARKALMGAKACGCLGPVAVHPGVMAGIDATIVLLMMMAGPVMRRNEGDGTEPLESTGWRPAWRRGAMALLGVLMLLCAGAVGYAAIPKRGLVAAEAGYYSFGVVPAERAMNCEHVFVVRNTSSRPVRITGQRSSCGCTVTDIPSAPIGPGESADVRVRANWSDITGTALVQVTLETDNRWTPRVPLVIAGEIRAATPTTGAAVAR